MTSIFTLVTLTLPRTMKLVCHPKLHQAPSSHQLTKTLQAPSHPPYEPLIRASKITKSKKPKPQLPCTGYNKIRQRSKASHRLKRRKTTSTSTSTNRITTITLSPNPLLKPPQPPTPIGGLPKKSMRIVYWSGLFCTKTINSSGSQPPVQHNNTPGVRTHGNKGWFDAAGVALLSVAKSYTCQRKMVRCRRSRSFFGCEATHGNKGWFEAGQFALFIGREVIHMATKDGSMPDNSPFSSVRKHTHDTKARIDAEQITPFVGCEVIHMAKEDGSNTGGVLFFSDQIRQCCIFSWIKQGYHRRFHVFQQGVSGVIRGLFSEL